MFWIHGGGFSEWSGNDQLFGPDFLVEQNVIVVTFNYRLGIFGFLSLGTPEYSGNMGLKDQQLALKWTYENIEKFSGDKERITIFGESAGKEKVQLGEESKNAINFDFAGGVQTHYQFLSRESQKYFNNAIVMSGTSMNFWAQCDENKIITLAYKIAEDLGGPKESPQDLIEFFKTVPSEKIVVYAIEKTSHRTISKDFAPIIESEFFSSSFASFKLV